MTRLTDRELRHAPVGFLAGTGYLRMRGGYEKGVYFLVFFGHNVPFLRISAETAHWSWFQGVSYFSC
jgi:hypothetical protein